MGLLGDKEGQNPNTGKPRFTIEGGRVEPANAAARKAFKGNDKSIRGALKFAESTDNTATARSIRATVAKAGIAPK